MDEDQRRPLSANDIMQVCAVHVCGRGNEPGGHCFGLNLRLMFRLACDRVVPSADREHQHDRKWNSQNQRGSHGSYLSLAGLMPEPLLRASFQEPLCVVLKSLSSWRNRVALAELTSKITPDATDRCAGASVPSGR